MLAPRVSSLNSISQRRKKKGAACRKFPRHRSGFEDILNLDYFCKSKGAAQRVLANAPMEPGNLKDGLHKPTFHGMAYMR